MAVNRDEATLHLFKKAKYDLGISVASKLMQLVRQSKDRTVFVVGGGRDHVSIPTSLVKAFTNVKGNNVRLSSRYSAAELSNLFEILMNLNDYGCAGLTRDYEDGGRAISSLINMTELSENLGMVEVTAFLKRIPALFTNQNRNAYVNELQRRNERVAKDDDDDDERRHRSKSRTSLSKVIRRSLSRGRRSRQLSP